MVLKISRSLLSKSCLQFYYLLNMTYFTRLLETYILYIIVSYGFGTDVRLNGFYNLVLELKLLLRQLHNYIILHIAIVMNNKRMINWFLSFKGNHEYSFFFIN